MSQGSLSTLHEHINYQKHKENNILP